MALTLLFFHLAITFREVQTFFRLIRQQWSELQPDAERPSDWFSLLHCALLIAQTNRYSGTIQERFLVNDKEKSLEDNTAFSTEKGVQPNMIRITGYSQLTQLSCLGGLFATLDPPQRRYSTREIGNVQPIYTSANWSLEEMFCRDSRKNVILVSQGSAALRSDQAYSSIACVAIGALLIAFFVLSFIVWLNAGVVLALLAALLCFVCCLLPMVKDSRSLYRLLKTVHDEESRDDETDSHVFYVWETAFITRPSPLFCYVSFAIEVVFLLLWPLFTLFLNNSWGVALVFLAVGLFSSIRKYFDASSVLARTGKIASPDDDEEPSSVVEQAQTAEIIGKVSRNQSASRWTWVFTVLVCGIYVFFLSALGSDLDFSPADRPEIILLPDFHYPGKPDLPYPTSKLSKGFEIPGSAQLQDFAFFAAIAYEEPTTTESILEAWFGPNKVVDEADFVDRYREATGTDVIPVWFKLFSFPDLPGFGLVSIRGSQTKWDWLANMMLWASSGLAQVVRAVLPFGWIWSPILDDLVRVVNSVESRALQDVSYYTTVARFCRDLLQGYTDATTGQTYRFNDLRLTGASLGGGIATITGAQTGINTIAISGPGAVIPRHTFDPPVRLSEVNAHVFNVIPDRDVIARIGGRGRLFQEIDCTSPNSGSLGSCHSMWRTLCEIAYTCGSQGRPALCTCVERFDYPEPERLYGNRTFSDVCNLN